MSAQILFDKEVGEAFNSREKTQALAVKAVEKRAAATAAKAAAKAAVKAGLQKRSEKTATCWRGYGPKQQRREKEQNCIVRSLPSL